MVFPDEKTRKEAVAIQPLSFRVMTSLFNLNK
jgi:hypothetical protein